MTFSRRGTLAAGAALASAAAGLPGLARAQGRQVVVGTWGGDYGELLRQNIDMPLIAPQGIEVLQDVANADPRKTKLLAERQARRGTMDVACLSDTDMHMMAQQNALDTLDMGRLSRSGSIVAGLRKPYAIPHIYSALVLLYNPDKVTTPPKSFADMWDPKYRGRVGFSDILYSTNTFAAAVAGGGSFSDYGPARDKLMALRSLDAKVYPSNEALAAALKGEEVWMAPMWLARGFMWQKAGIPLRHVVPSEAAYAIVFEAAVPRNSRNKDQAYAYLDAMLKPEAQTAFADRMGYLPTVTDASLPPEIARQISLTEAEQARLRAPDYDYLLRAHTDILDFWNKQFKA
ncbi:putative spermidine/putrescine transport system substrate-binding protein [Roseomonas rosea]|uniref:Putative spermidine/putrescine transport system substrate-binding protein n=1 Tax=Muricoccus roseus TaxID=198092 RepID=A0A1M6HRN4_9PROT|nr:ABC transporter substrate-binding protein [Roseomonas rosea]SHJ24870.1 putative spermidine/putrescine transport system substrate-binding protein [Roseomonas rosea]